MTLNEALKVSKIVELAEGGCSGCMSSAVEQLTIEFPGFNWTLVDIPGFSPGINVSLTAKTERQLREPDKYDYCGNINIEWVNWDNEI